MADENSFVEEIKFQVDDNELVAAIQNMKKEIGSVNRSVGDTLPDSFKKSRKEADKAAKETEKIAKASNRATKETNNLEKSFGRVAGAIKGAIAAYAGFKGVSELVGFVKNSIAAFNVQNRAEKMLEFGMRQNGTQARSQELKDYASQIQKNTIYGDEAMLTAAAAWQNKIRDVDNSKRMMDLVADFAARSTGGGAVDAGAMRGFAQQLMQSLSGRAITLKAQGFDISAIENLQKIRSSGGTVTEEMEISALEKVLSPIRGLAREISNTDEGKIEQLKNTIGDMREDIGAQLLPVVADLAMSLKQNLPTLRELFESLKDIFISLVTAIKQNFGAIAQFAKMLAGLFAIIAGNLPTVVAFVATMKTAGALIPVLSTGLTGLGAAIKGVIASNALGLLAAGIVALGVTAYKTYKKQMEVYSDDRRQAGDRKLKEWQDAQREFDASSGRSEYERRSLYENAQKKKEEFKAVVRDYASANGGTAYSEWGKALGEAVYMDNRANGGYGAIVKFTKASENKGDERNPFAGIDFESEYKKAMASVEKSAKGNTTINNVRVNNEIHADSEMTAKIIKDQLRELTTSRLNFTSRTAVAKAMTV